MTHEELKNELYNMIEETIKKYDDFTLDKEEQVNDWADIFYSLMRTNK